MRLRGRQWTLSWRGILLHGNWPPGTQDRDHACPLGEVRAPPRRIEEVLVRQIDTALHFDADRTGRLSASKHVVYSAIEGATLDKLPDAAAFINEASQRMTTIDF